jgi:hypothetical protein
MGGDDEGFEGVMSEQENSELAAHDSSVEEQLDLALAGEKLYIDYSERPFGADDRYTGERMLRDHPERAQLAIKLIALGFKNEPIARKVHCDHRIVRELRYRCVREIEQQRELLREIVFPGVAMSADRAIELLPRVNNAKDAAITHGILRDSYMALAGLPTAHIEVNHRFDLGAELKKLNDEAREMMKQAKARLVEPIALENGEAV